MPQTPLFKRWVDNIYPVSPKGLFCNNMKIGSVAKRAGQNLSCLITHWDTSLFSWISGSPVPKVNKWPLTKMYIPYVPIGYTHCLLHYYIMYSLSISVLTRIYCSLHSSCSVAFLTKTGLSDSLSVLTTVGRYEVSLVLKHIPDFLNRLLAAQEWNLKMFLRRKGRKS